MKLTTTATDSIVASIEQGHTIRVACITANIGRRTFYNWYKMGRDVKEAIDAADEKLELTTTQDACLNFYNRVEKALADYCVALQRKAKDHESYDPNQELAQRFGKNLDMAVDTEPEPKPEPVMKPSQQREQLKLLDEHYEKGEITEDEYALGKKRVLGVLPVSTTVVPEETTSSKKLVSDEKAREASARLRAAGGLPPA